MKRRGEEGRSPLNRLANRSFSRPPALALNLMLFSVRLFLFYRRSCLIFTSVLRRFLCSQMWGNVVLLHANVRFWHRNVWFLHALKCDIS